MLLCGSARVRIHRDEQRVGWPETPALLWSLRSMVAVSKRGCQRQLKQFQLCFGTRSLELGQQNAAEFLVPIHQGLGWEF